MPIMYWYYRDTVYVVLIKLELVMTQENDFGQLFAFGVRYCLNMSQNW